MTSFYDRHIMPRLIGCACSTSAVMKQRGKVVPLAAGRVLELGVGGGLNLSFYNPYTVSEVVGVDPSAELRQQAMAAVRADGIGLSVLDGRAEALPFEDASFDTVVCTFTLCSVRSPVTALTEARRVLKPNGQFLFCEHGLSPDAGVARWQRRIEPVWKRLAGGCHLTRPVGETLRQAGLAVERIETMYLPGAPKVLGWNEWGLARVV